MRRSKLNGMIIPGLLVLQFSKDSSSRRPAVEMQYIFTCRDFNSSAVTGCQNLRGGGELQPFVDGAEELSDDVLACQHGDGCQRQATYGPSELQGQKEAPKFCAKHAMQDHVFVNRHYCRYWIMEALACLLLARIACRLTWLFTDT